MAHVSGLPVELAFPHLRKAKASALVKELAVQIHQSWAFAGFDKRIGKGATGLVPFHCNKAIGRLLDGFFRLFEPVMRGNDTPFPGDVAQGDGAGQGDFFHFDPNQLNVAQIILGGRGHAEPALRGGFDQTFGRQNAQCFTHRMVRPAVTHPQVFDFELLVRQERPKGDVATQRGCKKLYNCRVF